MFGDMAGMMSKFIEAQHKVEETKMRLNTVFIDETGANGKIKISISANREIKSIDIDTSLLSDKEELEDYLIVTLNTAIQKATAIQEHELGAAAKSEMPSIPGMDFLK